MTSDQSALIYHAVPGGSDLVRWFGQVPSFHDAEVLSLHIRRKGQSVLCLHGWITSGEVGHNGYLVLNKHAVVSFLLDGVMDLQFEGFSAQNAVSGVVLRRAVDRPDRRGFLSLDPLPEDIEIELEPSYGLSGLIRARSVAIKFEPGQPNELGE